MVSQAAICVVLRRQQADLLKQTVTVTLLNYFLRLSQDDLMDGRPAFCVTVAGILRNQVFDERSGSEAAAISSWR